MEGGGKGKLDADLWRGEVAGKLASFGAAVP